MKLCKHFSVKHVRLYLKKSFSDLICKKDKKRKEKEKKRKEKEKKRKEKKRKEKKKEKKRKEKKKKRKEKKRKRKEKKRKRKAKEKTKEKKRKKERRKEKKKRKLDGMHKGFRMASSYLNSLNRGSKNTILNCIKSFHVTDSFLYLLKTSEDQHCTKNEVFH